MPSDRRPYMRVPSAEFHQLFTYVYETSNEVVLDFDTYSEAVKMRRDMYAMRQHVRWHELPQRMMYDSVEVVCEYRDPKQDPDKPRNPKTEPARMTIRRYGAALRDKLQQAGAIDRISQAPKPQPKLNIPEPKAEEPSNDPMVAALRGAGFGAGGEDDA